MTTNEQLFQRQRDIVLACRIDELKRLLRQNSVVEAFELVMTIEGDLRSRKEVQST